MVEQINGGMGPGSYPVPDLPRLSLVERDRRWAKIRAIMAREDVDVILTVSHSGFWDWGNANSRYLSHLGGNCIPLSIVFPREGEVTALVALAPAPDYWFKAQDWVTDIRANFFDMTTMAMDRLKELGLARGRLGIAGLANVARQPDGLVPVRTLQRIREGFPDAEIVDATSLLAEARAIKSIEEIDMLRSGVRVVEKAFDVLAEEARPGVPECVVYGRMMGSMIENGSEPTTMLNWTAGNPLPPVVATMPSRRPLGADDLIMIECEAKYGGYLAQNTITHWVGHADDTAHRMAELQYTAFLRCCEAMRPGTPFGSLVDVCAKVAEGTPFLCTPIAHGRGLGMDGPVLVYEARDELTRNWPIPENSSFIVKPNVRLPDGSRMVMWGDSVVVTPSGAERLGTRMPPLIKA